MALVVIFSVDMITGQPCVDFLDNPELWLENYSLSSLLISLQVLSYVECCNHKNNGGR